MHDIRRIADVHVRARRSAYRALVPASILAAEDVAEREVRWQKRLADPVGRCWLLTDESGLFGFAYTAPTQDDDLSREVAELYALYLLGERVGAGFGRHLVTHALDDLRARSFPEVVLWCAVENSRALRFYRSAGFELDARVDGEPLGDTGLTKRRLRQALTVAGAGREPETAR